MWLQVGLRNYQKMQNCYFSILSEIMDKRNVEILEADGKNDYIIGDYIQAGIIAQLSQTAELKEVFCSLLEVEGSEIYLKDITNYLSVLEDVNFYTLMESASRKNEIPIGFLRENKQIEINPKKNIKYSFSDKDKVIVIADRMAH